MKSTHSLIALTLIVAACTTNEVAQKESKTKQDAENDVSAIQPLSFNPDAEMYTVSATQADTIFAPSGSSIVFQPNAFVDADGKPVKGDVKVEWQEFHTLGDIVASGIPMKYDSAGVAYDLESGGMFTIHASQNGTPVEMAPGKKAEVNLSSIQDTPCYNFYKLDEKSGQWAYETTKEGESLEASDETAAASNGVKTIFDVQLNTAGFPELKDMDLIGWKSVKNVPQSEAAWIEQGSTKVRLVQRNDNGTYLMEAKAKEATKQYNVEPYDVVDAMEDSRTNHRELLAEANEIVEYARNVASGKVIRSIEIAGFGTYNWDVIHQRDNSLPLFASFEYPVGTNASLVTLRLISPDENMVVMYNSEGDDMFSFDPEKRNLLIGILPNNEIVAASDSEFDAARSKPNGAAHTFTLKKTGIKLSSPDDIMKHMNKLI